MGCPSQEGVDMIRRQTWIVLVLLAGVVGLAVYLNNKKATPDTSATPTGGAGFIFNSTEGLLTTLEIAPAVGTPVKVVRGSDNQWALKSPEAAEANQGSIEAAASQLTALKIVSLVQGDAGIFGFDKPAYIINVEFKDGKKHSLEVGDHTPSNIGYYVRLDKDKMMVVELSGIDALINLVSSPPYLNTPTPSPEPPTKTPSAAIETPASPGSQSAVTPTP
jgi:hypothetical protein